MELEIILGILSAGLAAIAAVAGRAWNKVKSKLGKAVNLFIEATDVANKAKEIGEEISKALEDNKITKEEVESLRKKLKGIKKELNDVKVAFKDLVSKEVE